MDLADVGAFTDVGFFLSRFLETEEPMIRAKSPDHSQHRPWRLARLILLTRPFTLIPPVIGMLAGAFAALGVTSGSIPVQQVIVGACMAAALNGASNVWNQLCDIELDRINKPHRLLVTGEVGKRAALITCAVLYAVALLLAWTIDSGGGKECFVIVALTCFITYAYSGAPFRWRRFGWRANLSIALPRGMLLKVAGWSTVAPVFHSAEPWCLGLVFFLFLLGATTTKDLEDVEGDRAGGVENLAVRLGKKGAIRVMAPFFVVPWLLLPLMGLTPTPLLYPDPILLVVLGGVLATYGAYVVSLLKRQTSDDSGRFENHIAWRHMYGLMMMAQVGSALIYHI